MKSDYVVLAFRNVRKRGIRSWLTMLGIFIGIAAVVSLISLGEGLQTAITGQFSSLSTNILTVTSAEAGFGPPGSTAVRKLNEHDLKIIESLNGVKSAIPRLIRVVKIEFNGVASFRFVGSMPKDSEKAKIVYDSFNVKTDEGRLLKVEDRGKIVLGSDFVRYDEFGKKIRVGSKLKIQNRDFEVVGILKRASTFQLNAVVLMNEDDMKDVLKLGDEIDMIAVQVDKSEKINQVANEIERKMRKDRKEKEGEEDFQVQTPLQALGAVSTIINIINLIVTGIAAISLLVGGIGIANTMFTSVLERTKEIGVMKAIGAENKDILFIFVIEAGMLGLVGGIIGAFVGLGLAYFVSLIASGFFGESIINVTISYPLLFGAITFSLFIGILSGIIPAIRASKLNPIEALRK